ncbi:MAG: cell division protein FtsQ/DivIB, partial [Candidatus Ancillula sp.]|nr:cell division protein FtsQ/DivIB [Candidatus Ancillula sp.]
TNVIKFKGLEDVEERIKKNRRRKILTFFKALGIIILAALVLGGAFWGIFMSSLFKITDYEIRGLENPIQSKFVHQEEIKNIGKYYKSSALGTLSWVQGKSVEKKIDAVQGVKKSKVEKRWPHTLVFEVTPRIPLMIYNNEIVDIEGVELAKSDNNKDYPVLNITNSDSNMVKEIESDILMIYNVLKDENLSIKEMSGTTRDDISLTQNSGVVIIIGNYNELTHKIADIHAVLDDKDLMKGKKSLDVSSPKNVVTK